MRWFIGVARGYQAWLLTVTSGKTRQKLNIYIVDYEEREKEGQKGKRDEDR